MLNKMKNYLQNHALRKTRVQLLTMSDRQLDDCGISRELLQQGISAWPWREDETTLAAQPGKMKASDINHAIRELSSMSDKDLRDIGIDRGSIRHSVVHGTPERKPTQAA